MVAVGVVDDVKLGFLKSSKVGSCKSCIRLEEPVIRIEEDGLGGFTIIRISGSMLLLVFYTEELFDFSKLNKWKAFDKWFVKKQVSKVDSKVMKQCCSCDFNSSGSSLSTTSEDDED
ncbi:hypothetical protein J1N35_025905 [Gossypium stocksii]|uniref:Uncharacterized protein n=1 Tax=Gossypium stocksii TaxID=47602 RepID=A0A9D3ZXL7_9ROSI|nr:hypothetical protein J1N35_025905 [Gossypium stocksii]